MIKALLAYLRGSTKNYAAAQSTARYGDIRASRGSADYELRESLAEIRAKARYLGRNSGAMRRFIQLMRVNVVGENGFRLQSRVKMGSGKLDMSLNDKVESEWQAWCAEACVDGIHHLIDLQHQAIATWCRDGELLWEIVYNPAYRDGIAINPLEADYLDESLNTVNPANGNQIKMGVEFDDLGRIVAYHLLTQHPGDTSWFSPKTQTRYRRVPKRFIIHLYDADRPQQSRGEPPSAAVINSVKMLDGYRESEVVGRRVRASLGGFFERIMPKADGLEKIADGQDAVDGTLEMNVAPGTVKVAPEGYAFKEFAPAGPTDYAPFEIQQKKDIASSFGISAFSHGMETSGVSYSTGRSVLIEDRDYYKTMQQFMIRHLMRPMFSAWIGTRILSDETAIMPSRVPVIIDRVTFRARGWDWVDPAKDVKANTEALRTRQTSLARVAAQRGIDRDELLDEIKEDAEAAKERGLTLEYDSAIPAQNNNSDGNPNDNTTE